MLKNPATWKINETVKISRTLFQSKYYINKSNQKARNLIFLSGVKEREDV